MGEKAAPQLGISKFQTLQKAERVVQWTPSARRHLETGGHSPAERCWRLCLEDNGASAERRGRGLGRERGGVRSGAKGPPWKGRRAEGRGQLFQGWQRERGSMWTSQIRMAFPC